MRKISKIQILIFLIFFSIVLTCALCTAIEISKVMHIGAYEPVMTIALTVVFTEFFAIVAYRLSLLYFKITVGEIAIHSKAEFAYHIHLLFFLFFFHPVIRSGILPVPIMKLIYLGLGAKMGDNTYSSGIIFDPIFVELGNNTIVGQGAILIPHVVENERLAHYKIKIGNNVTIGSGAKVLPGCTIEDGAIVSANAVVLKGTFIRDNEIWGGVPAKKISQSIITHKDVISI